MKVEKELFKKYLKWMFGCSIAVMLLNPINLFLLNPINLFFFPFSVLLYLYYFIPYVVVGTLVWYWLRDKEWKLQTLSIWLSSNVFVALLFLVLWKFLMKPEGPGPHCLSPFAFIYPLLYAVSAFLSVIPIGYCCRRFKKQFGR